MRKILMLAIVFKLLFSTYASAGVNIKEYVKKLTDNLYTKRIPVLPRRVYVLSFYDLKNINKSSPLGRLIKEMVSEQLIKKGVKIVEPKLANFVKLSEDGEFIISANPQNIRTYIDTKYIIVGSYLVASSRIFIQAKLIDYTSRNVISASTVEIPLDYEIKKLTFKKVKSTKIKIEAE